VRLAFETIEKIVREHFDYITETEARAQRPPAAARQAKASLHLLHVVVLTQ